MCDNFESVFFSPIAYTCLLSIKHNIYNYCRPSVRCACVRVRVKVRERARTALCLVTQCAIGKMRVELLVLMLFVCMTVGEFHSTYSNDILCVVSRVAGKDVEINILKGVSYTLRYLNGSCSWNVSIKGVMEDFVGGMGPQRIIEETDAKNGLVWKCFVGDDLKLQALFSVYGKYYRR